jgi:tetratricopeptide (TPR) repeat protein
MSPPSGAVYSEEATTRIISDDNRLIWGHSYLHRAFRPMEGGAVRDELTNTSLASPHPEDAPSEEAPRLTQSELFAQRGAAWRRDYVKAGWARLSAGEYRSAHDAFENVLALDSSNLEAKTGRILCSMMAEQYQSAVAYLKNLLVQHDDLLEVSYSFEKVLQNPARVEGILSRISYMGENYADGDAYAGLHAYLCWLDGRTQLARNVAEKLQREHPTSPYALLADRIREKLEPAEGLDAGSLPELRALSGAVSP